MNKTVKTILCTVCCVLALYGLILLIRKVMLSPDTPRMTKKDLGYSFYLEPFIYEAKISKVKEIPQELVFDDGGVPFTPLTFKQFEPFEYKWYEVGEGSPPPPPIDLNSILIPISSQPSLIDDGLPFDDPRTQFIKSMKGNDNFLINKNNTLYNKPITQEDIEKRNNCQIDCKKKCGQQFGNANSYKVSAGCLDDCINRC